MISNESVHLMETNPNHELNSEIKLHDIECCMLKSSDAKEKVKLFTPDGARYSSSAQQRHITQLPFFRLNLDSKRSEFHFYCMKAPGKPLAHLVSSENKSSTRQDKSST